MYVSFNKGNSWELFSKGLTNAAVHDLVIQKEAKDLVVGTHGRSIYKADISGLQQFNTVKSNSVSIFDISSLRSSSFWGSIRNQYSQAFEPSVVINFYSNESGSKQIKILSQGGTELNIISVNADKGFNTAEYNLQLTEKGRKALLKENSKLRINKADNGNYYLPSGKYTVNIDGVSKPLKIE